MLPEELAVIIEPAEVRGIAVICETVLAAICTEPVVLATGRV